MTDYSKLSDEALVSVIHRAEQDAENAMRSNSPSKLFLYNRAKETHDAAFAEYYKRYANKGKA